MDYNTSMEQKLTLIRTLRNEQEQNKDKLRVREEILYPGVDYKRHYESVEKDMEIQTQTHTSTFFFAFRLCIAIALFLLFFFMDINQYKILEITSETIIAEINSPGIDFMLQFPYTLTIK